MSGRSAAGGSARERAPGQAGALAPSPSRRVDLAGGVHLLGAGGAGVSGAALLLHARGARVTCADRAESEHTRMLRERGLDVRTGAAALTLPGDVDVLVRSAAVPSGDPVVQAAFSRGAAVLKYSDLLGLLAPAGRTLAVAGTHGKTTTSWMLHHTLRGLLDARRREAGRPLPPGLPQPGALPAPGALVGGISVELGVNALEPAPGGWFAVEACEYDRSFLKLAPAAAAITNVEADHLDYYGSLEAIEAAFARFADRVHPQGLLAVGSEVSPRIVASPRCRVWRLGHELRARVLAERQGCFTFGLRGPGFHVERVALGVPGRFNVDNAALALALAVGVAAHAWGLDPADAAACAARGLERFRGSLRRFERWGAAGGVEVVHDYAHHPTEVRVTLEAARRAFPGRPLHVLFQPHQHSRTARFLSEFAASLRPADRVVVSDVYGARLHIDAGHSAGAEELAGEIERLGGRAVAAGALEASVERFVEGLPADAAALVLGAGDIGGIRHGLFARLALSGAARG